MRRRVRWQRANWVLPLQLLVLAAACGDSAQGSSDREAPTGQSASSRVGPAEAPSTPFRGIAIDCRKVDEPRSQEFDVPKETARHLVFTEEANQRDHSVWVFPWSHALKLRLSEAKKDSLGVRIDVIEGQIGDDEYWGILTLDAQPCWNKAKAATAYSHEDGANQRERRSRGNEKSHEITILLQGNSTYVLGAPGMLGTESGSADTGASRGQPPR